MINIEIMNECIRKQKTLQVNINVFVIGMFVVVGVVSHQRLLDFWIDKSFLLPYIPNSTFKGARL